MLRRALFWLSGRLPLRVIEHEGAPLFERYLVARGARFELFLHHYLRPDPARALHNHPWRWMWVWVLAGWYFEEREDHAYHLRRAVRGAYEARRSVFHALRLLSPGGTWSLVLCGPRCGSWGYLREDGGYDPLPDDGARFDWAAAPRGRFAQRANP